MTSNRRNRAPKADPLERHFRERDAIAKFEPFLTKKELAKALAVSQVTIWKQMKEGLPYFKIGRSVRYRLIEVSDWLERRCRP